MDNAIYISLGRQQGKFRHLDVVANNVANVNTAGFKGQDVLFETFSVKAGNKRITYTNDSATQSDVSQGELKVTNRQLDVAISGEGYFTVNTPQGVRYTRAGNFVRAQDGSMVTPQGYTLLGQGNTPIVLQEEDFDITIREDGSVTAGPNNDARGTIQILEFQEQQALTRLGNGLYSSEEKPKPSQDFVLQQGMLESSNVNSVKEMTRMIGITRAAEGAAKIANDLHDLRLRTISALSGQ